MNKKALKILAITSTCLIAILFTKLVYENEANENTNSKVCTLSELEQSDNVVVEEYSVKDYYNLMIKENNIKSVNYLKNKYFNNSTTSEISALASTYIKVIKWRDPKGPIFDLVSGMALEVQLHPNLNEEIAGYVQGTAFCEVDGVQRIQFIKDFDPIVTIPNRNNAYFITNGSLVGQVDIQLQEAYEAQGFKIGSESTSTIYVSQDKTINHSYYCY